jgi:chromosome segregation ATPase
MVAYEEQSKRISDLTSKLREAEESRDHYIKLSDEKREDARYYSEKVNELQSSLAVKDASLERQEKNLAKYGEHRAGCQENSKFETCVCGLNDEKILLMQTISSSTPNDLLEALKGAKEALGIALNTVECASLDKNGTELPWHISANKALASLRAILVKS